MNEKLISIIIPIFNVKDYLKRCIESVQVQTHSNIEIILVDDGSWDGSSEICDQYRTIDSRVKVIHQKNSGISAARNSGMHISNGEYIAFVDSDDYLHIDFLKILLNCALENEAEISVCSFIKVYQNHEVAINNRVEKKLFSNVGALKDVLSYPSTCDVMVWNKLYKKSLFIDHLIEFPVGKIYEDTFIIYRLLYAANKVAFINLPLYYYLQRRGSIMHSSFNVQNFDMLEAANETVAWVDKFEPSLDQMVRGYRLRFQITLINRITDAKNIDEKLWGELSKTILNDSIHLKNTKYISQKHKLFIRIIGFGKIPYTICRKIYLLKKETV